MGADQSGPDVAVEARRHSQGIWCPASDLSPAAVDLVEVAAPISGPALHVDPAMQVNPATPGPGRCHAAVRLLPGQALRYGALAGQTGLQVGQRPHMRV